MASYLMLLGTDDKTGFPIGRDPSPEGYPNALENFVRVGSDLADYEASKALLLKRARGSVVPVTFSRYRDCRVLADTKTERFFVLMSLLPGKHPLNQKTAIQDRNLIDINTGEIFSYRGSQGVLFPLEVGIRNGRWHWQYERFFKPVMDGLAAIKSAKLVRKEANGAHEYFLQLSFAFEAPELYEPEAYLGIDMGILFTMAYSVIDTGGRVLLMNHEPDGYRELQRKIGMGIAAKQKAGRQVTYRDFKNKQKEEVLHILINRIVDVALKHRAGIIIEKLNVRVRGRWVKSAWKKIAVFLKEKCKRHGIPFREVFAYNSSRICIHCGELVERDDRVVACPACGAVEHSDSAAGVNVARRAMYRKKEWLDRGGYRAFHRSFANVPVLATKIGLWQETAALV